jgi:hypothetical protein
MPGPTAGSAVSAGRARTLTHVYRRFGEVDAAGTSPLYGRVAVALSESSEALRAIKTAPARKRHPTVILAALHDLALAGRASTLAAAYAAADGDAAAGAAIDTLLRMTESVVATAVRRPTRPNETGRCAVLYPAIAEATRLAGANTVGLIDVGCGAGLNLSIDRVGTTCSPPTISRRATRRPMPWLPRSPRCAAAGAVLRPPWPGNPMGRPRSAQSHHRP